LEEYHVSQADIGQRLDVFLARKSSTCTRSRLKLLIDNGQVLKNGRRARPRDLVRNGDFITLRVPAATASALSPEPIEIPFLYEDSDLIVLNKPARLSVHPGAGQASGTLVNALLYHCSDLSGIGGQLRPGIVHRLDKDTTGCLVVAKNDKTHLALSRQFAERQVKKLYLALCRGRVKKKRGEIEENIARHPVQRQKMAVVAGGRKARTGFQVIQEVDGDSLVVCRLFTGRTHQIRVHLHHLGHPLLGDRTYGGSDPRFSRQMLHAWRLGFWHPSRTDWIQIEAPVPEDFVAAGVDAGRLAKVASDEWRG
jgi:23S rRNA pseudouridine1911/1915/1917 synthase